MLQTKKCLEYYLDSRLYGSKEIQKVIEDIKKEFPKQKIQETITLNDWGVYIIKINFMEEIKEYGKYKNTGSYKPY